MESVPDSKAWKHINAVYPEFAFEERNIRLRMVVDGVNPYSNPLNLANRGHLQLGYYFWDKGLKDYVAVGLEVYHDLLLFDQ
jgi:hypothetical protein